MFAEQIVTARFPAAGQLPGVEVELALRVEVPGAPGVDVATGLHFEPGFPEAMKNVPHQHIHDGVHGGLAAIPGSLPSGGVAVAITGLRLRPEPDAATPTPEVRHTGRLLRVTVTWAVAALWDALGAIGEAAE